MDNKELMKLMFDCYKAGIAEGQLSCEQERQGEEMFDAFAGSVFSKKTCMPATVTERRQLRSEKRFEAKRKEADKFYDLLNCNLCDE